VPLYLPIVSDELAEHSVDSVFFGGINVYLQQKSSVFRNTPRWLDSIFDSPSLLKWAAKRGGMTNAGELGDMTLSMLRGEDGNQVKELKRLVSWLAEKTKKPDVIHISNALLLGMVPRIKSKLHVPVVCSLQDEDIWVDALPEPQRQETWEIMAQLSKEVDAFIAVSNYYKDFMCERLDLPDHKVHVVYNAIDLKDYEQSSLPMNPPVIGFLERQCREKGLSILANAFIILKKSSKIPGLKLRIAGGSIVEDAPFLKEVNSRFFEAGVSNDLEFLPNLGYEERLEFLKTITIMSVPAEHKEAFGIYIIEALASGVPVVEPNQGAFPELIGITKGGILYEPNDPEILAKTIESLLLSPENLRKLGELGKKTVFEKFSVDYMAQEVIKILIENVTRVRS
jgi:glycosyltransferase involved in cell wall biosynthesis